MAIDSIQRDEITECLAASGKCDAGGWSLERTIAQGHRSAGWIGAKAGAGRRFDNEAGLVAELGGGRALERAHLLNRAYGNLVGEDAALLIGNRLAVDAERGFRMFAENGEACRHLIQVASGERENLFDVNCVWRRRAGQPKPPERELTEVRVFEFELDVNRR